ncbi:MAG: threonylcarbamoyl-AMP synthase [Actinobacteria bacterium]|nr:threonylcarbamoyl-AMP synthase [Actinomycetota bacterium]
MQDADLSLIVRRCAEVLAMGELAIIPTDTVYGLAARADVHRAVEAVFRAKGRDAEKALVVMVSGIEEAAELTVEEERETLRRLGTLWPGPLTLVVKASEIPWRESVAPSTHMLGIRVPDSPLLLSLLSISGPLAVSSANLAGGPAPASFAEIDEGLLAKVGLAVDGGKSGSGRPSAVVKISEGELTVLRQGEICEDELMRSMLRYGEDSIEYMCYREKKGGT